MDRKEFLENLGDTEDLSKRIGDYIDSVRSKEVSRRSFLKGSVLVTGAAALSATGANLFNRKILPEAKAQETQEQDMATKLQIKGNSDKPLNYYFRTAGPIRKEPFQKADISSSSRTLTELNHAESSSESNSNFQSADSDNFEDVLREKVGAKKGRSWQEFVDNVDQRAVHNVEDYGAELDGQTDDKSALMEAINQAAQEDPSGIVLLPEGELLYSNRIQLTSDHNGVAIVGKGHSSVLRRGIDPGNDDYAGIVFEAPYSTPQSASEFNNRNIEFRDVTLANFRINGEVDGRSNPGWAIWQDMSKGRNIRVENLWAENFNAGPLFKISGQRIRNITTVNNRGHGIVFDNGATQYTVKYRNLDVEPMIASRIYSKGNGFDVKGRYGIDVSTGKNIYLNGFISEENTQGMKVPRVQNARIYNGLTAGNELNGIQMNAQGDNHDVYFQNIRTEKNGENGFRIANGNVRIGTLVADGNGNNNIYIPGTAQVTAESLISRNSENRGMIISADRDIRVKNLTSRGNKSSNLSIKNSNVTVENLEVDSVSGNVTRENVKSPKLPDPSDL